MDDVAIIHPCFFHKGESCLSYETKTKDVHVQGFLPIVDGSIFNKNANQSQYEVENLVILFYNINISHISVIQGLEKIIFTIVHAVWGVS